MTTPMQVVPVAVTNPHELRPEREKPRDVEITCRTFTVKTGQTSDPNDSLVKRILDRDPQRVHAIINVFSGTVYLCHSRSAALAAAADASTLGTSQDGFLISSGQPIPPILTNDPVWIAIPTDKASSGAQVSVISERRRA